MLSATGGSYSICKYIINYFLYTSASIKSLPLFIIIYFYFIASYSPLSPSTSPPPTNERTNKQTNKVDENGRINISIIAFVGQLSGRQHLRVFLDGDAVFGRFIKFQENL
jgi:hypothetical protein